METEQERLARLDKEASRKGVQKVKAGRRENLRNYQIEQEAIMKTELKKRVK